MYQNTGEKRQIRRIDVQQSIINYGTQVKCLPTQD